MRNLNAKILSDFYQVARPICFASFVMSACAQDAARDLNCMLHNSMGVGVGADSDTLLKTLAEVAREGVPALCNVPYLERRLNIKIQAPRISESERSRSTVADVESAFAGVRLSQSMYGSFITSAEEDCYLSINFENVFLCNARSSHVKKIYGQDFEFSEPVPGRSTRGIFYTFVPISGGRSTITLGNTDHECIHGFSMSAKKVKHVDQHK